MSLSVTAHLLSEWRFQYRHEPGHHQATTFLKMFTVELS